MRARLTDDGAGASAFGRRIRDALRDAGVFTISVIGGTGCGKTTLIEATIEKLMPEVHVGVVACDPITRRDADPMARHTHRLVQVHTGQAHHPDALHIYRAIGSLDLEWIDLLFVENTGSLTGPAKHDVGQDMTVAVFSVAAGDDKADKQPELVRSADIILINKVDLLGCVPFDIAAFRADVRRLNPKAEVIEMSGLHAHGVDRWLEWLKKRVQKAGQEAASWFG